MNTLADDSVSLSGRNGRNWLASRRFELALAICGALAGLLVILDIGVPVFAVFIVLAWFTVPGWTLARLTPIKSALGLLFVAIISSAVVTAVLSLIMAWTGWWAPQPTAVVVLLATSIFTAVTPRLRHKPVEPPATAATAQRTTAERLSGLAPVVVGIVAISLWLVSLAITDEGNMGKWGLLPVLPVTWYLSVGIMLALCIWGLLSQKRFPTWYMAGAVGSLVLMIYGSANLIESSPRLVWTYKHIAVTSYIDAYGHIDPSLDIYNRWPGVFAVSAFVGRIAGYPDPLSYATWAEPLFALIDAALVFGIARALTSNSRMAWTATLAFSLCNWVNQNYYSPQAFAYTLYLSMCLIVMTFLRSTPQPWISLLENPITRAFTRSTTQRKRREKGTASRQRTKQKRWSLREDQSQRRLRIASIVAVLVLQAVITASHQLTPYLVILGLFPLIFTGYVRPRWLSVGIVVIPLLYLLPNLGFVQSKYGLFSGFNLFANVAYTPSAAVRVTDAAVFGARAATILSIITVLLAALGWIRNLQKGNTGTTVMVAWLAVAPILALFGQSYGGEGRLRVFLFGAPWYAISIAWLFWSETRHYRRVVIGLSSALAVMVALFVIIYFQPEADYAVPKREITAAQWLDTHISNGDAGVQMIGNFPLLIGPHYSYFNSWASGTPILTSPIGNPPSKLTGQTIERYLTPIEVPHIYLIFSDAQTLYAVNHEMLSANEMRRIETSVEHSSAFVRVFDNSEVRIYQFLRP
ncbi:hypothetical protein [Parafrigoribacterium humi]|uniref:hypothetical protein n=1 Tax=Parafrigoribacterium humi TaxID=3144664 RepID=UPI0032ECA819